MRTLAYFLGIFLIVLATSSVNGFVHGRFNKHHAASKPATGPTCEPDIDDEQRFDCYPEYGASESACISRGCCWRPPKFNKLSSHKFDKKNRNYLLNVPYCYYPTGFPNYQVVSTKKYKNGYSYTLLKANATFRPNELLKLEARILLESSQRARVQIIDPNNDRYQVPLFDESERVYDHSLNGDNTDFQFYVHQDPFYIQIFRKSTGRKIFDTSVAPMIYADQYIEFSTSLPTNYFYGLGEHRDNMAHTATWKSFTLWNRDFPPTINTNLYGTHPFYMSIETDKNAFGFYLLNSNAMDINVQPSPALTFITIGGIIDFYIYMGPTPGDIVRQHTDVVGRSAFPPYWTLGFHLCRWKYDSSDRLRQIIERNRAALIPYDTQWTDIDGMSAQMDWTYDQKDFATLPDVVQDLHSHGQHYINIIDPAISVTTGYEPYESGLESNVFIKMANSDDPLVGIVWPGKTVFPDFTHPNATKWWTDCAAKFHQSIPFDGIWIDMNEPSNFVDGSMVGCFDNSTYDRPPYTPKVLGNQLSAKTVCPSARQHISNHYNLHNMYGHFEAKATYAALLNIRPGKRPFVLTRSSFAGTGKYAAHWSGDNRALWEDMYYSIPSMLNFNMFGVSMVGSDICGFSDNTTEELCVRWMQLGSFYPFMRNHNANNANDQDPAAFSLAAQSAMRKALQIRYSILPYMYTLFYRSTSLGDTVARPLFFEFTSDPDTHKIDGQFMLGPALLITPVLQAGAVNVRGYFPPSESWFKFVTGERLDTSASPYQVVDAPLDEINVHIRSGYIIPTQRPSLTTVQSRKNPFVIVVALKTESDGSQSAAGNLFWDDGESLDSIDSKKYNFFNFLAKKGSLSIDRVQAGYKTQMTLDEVKIYDVQENVNKVTINGNSFDNFIYDDIHKTLRVQYFNIDMMENNSIVINWS